MPKDLEKKSQYKSQSKAAELAYEVGSEKSSGSIKENKSNNNQPI